MSSSSVLLLPIDRLVVVQRNSGDRSKEQRPPQVFAGCSSLNDDCSCGGSAFAHQPVLSLAHPSSRL